jgi:hypothetical protein
MLQELLRLIINEISNDMKMQEKSYKTYSTVVELIAAVKNGEKEVELALPDNIKNNKDSRFAAFSELSNFLIDNNSLTTLYTTKNQMSSRDADCLVFALEKNTSITKIEIIDEYYPNYVAKDKSSKISQYTENNAAAAKAKVEEFNKNMQIAHQTGAVTGMLLHLFPSDVGNLIASKIESSFAAQHLSEVSATAYIFSKDAEIKALSKNGGKDSDIKEKTEDKAFGQWILDGRAQQKQESAVRAG